MASAALCCRAFRGIRTAPAAAPRGTELAAGGVVRPLAYRPQSAGAARPAFTVAAHSSGIPRPGRWPVGPLAPPSGAAAFPSVRSCSTQEDRARFQESAEELSRAVDIDSSDDLAPLFTTDIPALRRLPLSVPSLSLPPPVAAALADTERRCTAAGHAPSTRSRRKRGRNRSHYREVMAAKQHLMPTLREFGANAHWHDWVRVVRDMRRRELPQALVSMALQSTAAAMARARDCGRAGLVGFVNELAATNAWLPSRAARRLCARLARDGDVEAILYVANRTNAAKRDFARQAASGDAAAAAAAAARLDTAIRPSFTPLIELPRACTRAGDEESLVRIAKALARGRLGERTSALATPVLEALARAGRHDLADRILGTASAHRVPAAGDGQAADVDSERQLGRRARALLEVGRSDHPHAPTPPLRVQTGRPLSPPAVEELRNPSISAEPPYLYVVSARHRDTPIARRSRGGGEDGSVLVRTVFDSRAMLHLAQRGEQSRALRMVRSIGPIKGSLSTSTVHNGLRTLALAGTGARDVERLMDACASAHFAPTPTTFLLAMRAYARVAPSHPVLATCRAFARRGWSSDVALSVGIVGEMVYRGIAPDTVRAYLTQVAATAFRVGPDTYAALLHGVADELRRRLSRGERDGFFPHYDLLLELFARRGDVDGARRVLDDMYQFGTPPRVGEYNTILAVHARGGDIDGARRTLRELQAHGFVPNAMTLSQLLRLFTRARNCEGVERTLEMVRVLQVTPDAQLLNNAIQAYTVMGMPVRARSVFHELVAARGAGPDGTTQRLMRSVNAAHTEGAE